MKTFKQFLEAAYLKVKPNGWGMSKRGKRITKMKELKVGKKYLIEIPAGADYNFFYFSWGKYTVLFAGIMKTLPSSADGVKPSRLGFNVIDPFSNKDVYSETTVIDVEDFKHTRIYEKI